MKYFPHLLALGIIETLGAVMPAARLTVPDLGGRIVRL